MRFTAAASSLGDSISTQRRIPARISSPSIEGRLVGVPSFIPARIPDCRSRSFARRAAQDKRAGG
jgi:hypothetical protein